MTPADSDGMVHALPGNVETWPTDTSAGEVAEYASKQFPTLLLCFVAAARRKNVPGMRMYLRAMRHVMTRMEQWARMKEKQWAKQGHVNPNMEVTRE